MDDRVFPALTCDTWQPLPQVPGTECFLLSPAAEPFAVTTLLLRSAAAVIVVDAGLQFAQEPLAELRETEATAGFSVAAGVALPRRGWRKSPTILPWPAQPRGPHPTDAA